MKISIALCTYNGASFLQQQLDSIANQVRLPDELVICDDASDDDTAFILQTFANAAPFPVAIHINHTSIGSTKNFEKAIGLCNGDIIALCDQDDVWYPEKLLRYEEIFTLAEGVGLIFSDADLVDEKLELLGQTMWQSIGFNAPLQQRLERESAFEVLLIRNYVTGATLAFRSIYRDAILPISPAWVHDGWIAIVISLYADLVPIPQSLVQYRQHTQSQIGTTVRKQEQIANALQMHRRGYQKMSNHYIELQKRVKEIEHLQGRESINELLDRKISHLQTRATLPDNRFKRIPLILRELIKGHYLRYSRGGILGAARDFLL